MRKKKFSKMIASLLSVSLVLGACPLRGPFASEVEAAETVQWETVKEWKFDGGSEDTDEWSAINWGNGTASTTCSVIQCPDTDGKLKIVSNYNTIQGETNGWNPGGISGGLIPIGADGEAELTFELYCVSGDSLPANIQINTDQSDYQHGKYPYKAWGKAVRDSGEDVVIESQTCDKYNVSFSMSDLVSEDCLKDLVFIRSNKDFNGTIYIDNIVLKKKVVSTSGGGNLSETVLFKGSCSISPKQGEQQAVNQEIKLSQTTFTMDKVTSTGHFRVEYEATEQSTLVLALQYYIKSDDNVWKNIEPSSSGVISENKYYAEYDYAKCKSTWDSDESLKGKNWSDVQNIYVQTWGTDATVTSVKWIDTVTTTTIQPTITNDLAVLNQAVMVSSFGTESDVSYQWYKSSAYQKEGIAIEGATSASYTPVVKDIGSWIYCTVKDGNGSGSTNKVRVVGSSEIKERFAQESLMTVGEYDLVQVSNTTNAQGSFDVGLLAKNGYFYVEYKGIEGEPQLDLGTWSYGSIDPSKTDHPYGAQVTASESGTIAGSDAKYAKYSYADCVTAWKTEDFSDLLAIRMSYSGTDKSNLVVTKVSWFGPSFDDGAYVLFKGSNTATGEQASLFYDYTKHVGGQFDTSKINYGSYFEAVYGGDKDRLILSFSSNSGGTNWIAVKPSESTDNGDRTYTARFTIEDCIKGNANWGGFGTNMQRLDQIAVWTKKADGDATDPTITLKSLKYYSGTGELVDQSNNSTWTGKKTTGIGLIGDSIIHNPLVNGNTEMGVFAQKDWNKILERSDCSNWGIGGQTTEHIKNRIADMLSAPYEYNTFVTLCGINDMGYRTPEQIVANYKEIYEQIHTKRPNAKVFTISLLPTAKGGIYASFNNGIADTSGQAKICEINKQLQALINTGTTSDGTSIASFVKFVDCHGDFLDTDASEEADRIYANPAYVFKAYDEATKATLDGLHPNEAGYRVIAEKLKPLLLDACGPSEMESMAPIQPEQESITIKDDSSWPYFEFKVSGGAVQLGTAIEYDVVVESNTFQNLYLETNVNWAECDVHTWKGSDFSQNADGSYTKHVKLYYVGEKLDALTGVQVKIGTGDGRTDYRGQISVKNLTYDLAEAPAVVDETDFVTSALYTAEKAIVAWGYEKITQSMPKMAENGYFRVEYDATEKTNVRLVLCQWNTDKSWVHVRPSKTGMVKEGTYFAEYSYDACKYAFGNLSDVNEICVTVYDNTGITLNSVIWKGPKVTIPDQGGSNTNWNSNSTSDKDKEGNEYKDAENKDNQSADTNVKSELQKESGVSQTIAGQDFIVTKGGKNGKAEVAFVEAPENAKKIVVPDKVVIDGVTCKVTSIAAEAFKGNKTVKTITIGSNVKKIGEEAFAGCTSLTKVTIPASVTEIDAKAFNGCKKLKKITITSTKLKSIGKNALKGLDKNAVIDVPDKKLKAYRKLFTAKTGFKKTMKLK